VNQGSLSLTGCTLTGNEALGALNSGSSEGGALGSDESTITITSCAFSSNLAQAGAGATSPNFLVFGGDAEGGALNSSGDQLTITNSSFTANQAVAGNAGADSGVFGFGGR
jgi:hypothetical protein